MATVCEEIRAFPEDARRDAGHQLNRVQHGLEPNDWKPMSSVGAGVREIRIHQGGEFRVLYIARLAESGFVLHAFQKKSRKTPKKEIELAADRFRAVVEELRRRR